MSRWQQCEAVKGLCDKPTKYCHYQLRYFCPRSCAVLTREQLHHESETAEEDA